VSNALPQSPVLVRKLRRKRHWQSLAATDDEQVTEIAQEVFLYDRTPYSMYRVSSEAELDRVALALNSGRDSLTEERCFVWFTDEEVAQAGVPVAVTPGGTPCHLANHLHVDCNAQEADIYSLVRLAKAAQRDVLPTQQGGHETGARTRHKAAVSCGCASIGGMSDARLPNGSRVGELVGIKT
jgi:hypothetical protein